MGAERAPLVGRDVELRVLLETVGASDRSVILAGEAGSGKTRLHRELIARIEASGAPVMRAVATASASAVPFGALAHLLPEGGGEATDRHSVLRRAAQGLTGTGTDRLVLAVDDAHLVDELSAALIHQLVTTRQAIVVLTVRSGEPVADGISSLWKDDYAERVEVLPLARSETEALARSMLDGTIALRTFARIWEATRGNPLFVRETVLGALESGALSDRTGIWVWDEGRPNVRLRELVALRVGGVTPDERRGLELLALAEPISATQFEEIAPGVLADLERRGLVVEHADGRRSAVRLIHPVHAEVLRAEMKPRHARALRTELVRAFITRGNRRRDDTLRVAMWHLDSDEGPRVPLLLAGYDASNAATQFELALRFITRVRDAQPNVLGHRWRYQNVLHYLGRAEQAGELLDTLLDDEGPDEDRAKVAMSSSAIMRDAGRVDDALSLLRRAAETLPPGSTWAERLDAYRAEQLWQAGRYRDAMELTSGARAKDAVASAFMTAVGALALATTGRPTEALAIVDGAEAPPDAYARSLLLHGYLRSLAIQGRLMEAIEQTAALHAWAVEAGDELARQSGAVGLAAFFLANGRPRTAVAYARESNAVLRTMNPGQSYYGGYEAEAYALLGDGDAALAALEHAPRSRPPEHPDSLRQRAWVACAGGDISQARRLAVASADAFAADGASSSELFSLYDAVRLGSTEQAGRLCVLAEACQGTHAAAVGRHATGLRDDDADVLADASVQLEDVGRVLCAAEASSQAAIAYRRHGLASRASSAAARADALAARCEGAATPILAAGPLPDPLTRRERDVVELARRGLASKAIATTLVVSVRTVETYLQRAYAKLGISSRRELIDDPAEDGSS